MIKLFCDICEKEIGTKEHGLLAGKKFTVKDGEHIHGSCSDIKKEVHLCQACCDETLQKSVQGILGSN